MGSTEVPAASCGRLAAAIEARWGRASSRGTAWTGSALLRVDNTDRRLAVGMTAYVLLSVANPESPKPNPSSIPNPKSQTSALTFGISDLGFQHHGDLGFGMPLEFGIRDSVGTWN